MRRSSGDLLTGDKLRLFHAPSSYYSMIARLALTETGVRYEPVYMDIHLRLTQQSAFYARLNPNMTVPTLEMPTRNLNQSRSIAELAFGLLDGDVDGETRRWLDLHYSFPIEDLTMGSLMADSRLARVLFPRRLAAIHRHLLAMASSNADLAEAYRARAAVFAERIRTFDPEASAQLVTTRRAEAIGLMEQLEGHLSQGAALLVPPTYGIADVVWTVFLARMVFVGLTDEINKRPALQRYWTTMQTRPSFAAADIWTRADMPRLIGGIVGIR